MSGLWGVAAAAQPPVPYRSAPSSYPLPHVTYSLPPAAYSAPPGIETTSAVRECLTGHSLAVLIGEEFANRWVDSTNQETGDVNEIILGAFVTGVQTTESRTRLNILPNPAIAEMQVVLDGTTTMETNSRTPQASILSSSGFQFSMNKQVQFPGEYLQTWTPSGCLIGGQRHFGARTRLSGVPIAGPIASRIAIGAANEQKPLSTEISARKLSDKVGPRFNAEVDEQITTVNLALANRVRPKLEELNLKPSSLRTLSTDDAILVGALFDASSSAPTVPDLSRIPVSQRVVLMVHESLAAQLVGRVGLAGMELPGSALPGVTADAAEPNGGLSLPASGSLVLDPDDPVSMRFDGEEIAIRVRGTFKAALGPSIPTQDINVVVRPERTGGRLVLNGRLVSITPASGATDALIARIVETVIRPQVEARLKPIDLPTAWNVPHPKSGGVVPTQLQTLSIRDGWLVAEVALANGVLPAAPIAVPFGPSQPPTSLGTPQPPVPIQPSWEPGPSQGPILPPIQGF